MINSYGGSRGSADPVLRAVEYLCDGALRGAASKTEDIFTRAIIFFGLLGGADRGIVAKCRDNWGGWARETSAFLIGVSWAGMALGVLIVALWIPVSLIAGWGGEVKLLLWSGAIIMACWVFFGAGWLMNSLGQELSRRAWILKVAGQACGKRAGNVLSLASGESEEFLAETVEALPIGVLQEGGRDILAGVLVHPNKRVRMAGMKQVGRARIGA